MEQGHHVETAVSAGQRQAGRDVAGRGTDITLRQGDDFWPRCRARCMQYQRDGIRVLRAIGAGGTSRSSAQGEIAGGSAGRQLDDGNAEFCRNLPCRCLVSALDNQCAGFQILQIEIEFLCPVSRVQGGGGNGGSHGHKGGRHFRPVRQYNGNGIPVAQAKAVQGSGCAFDQFAQAKVTEGRAVGSRNGIGIVAGRAQQIMNGSGGHGRFLFLIPGIVTCPRRRVNGGSSRLRLILAVLSAER